MHLSLAPLRPRGLHRLYIYMSSVFWKKFSVLHPVVVREKKQFVIVDASSHILSDTV